MLKTRQILRLRYELGLTLREIGQACNCGKTTVSYILIGELNYFAFCFYFLYFFSFFPFFFLTRYCFSPSPPHNLSVLPSNY